MLTMTSLPPDSLPPGSRSDSTHLRFPGISSNVSSSVISPLTLPRGATGYFDHPSATGYHPTNAVQARKARTGNLYSPLSPTHVPQFLSPHLTPITREVQHQLQPQRSASLSPTGRMASIGANRAGVMVSPPRGLAPGSAIVDPAFVSNTSMPALSSASSGHPRSVSADAVGVPSQAQMVRRLVQQNGRIREAWEAERKYMEANRERAEEVYKEERALMEEERAEWEEEKAALVHHIERLEQQVLALGGDVRLSGEDVVPGVNGTGAPGANALRSGSGAVELEQRARIPPDSAPQSQANPPPVARDGGTGSGGDAPRGFNRTAVSFHPMAAAAVLPPLQTDLLAPIQERISPPKQRDFSATTSLPPSAIPLPPSSSDSMASLDQEDAGPIPIVDIQVIHPELEGIPIKAPAVQKPTFTDNPSPSGSRSSSNASSPSQVATQTGKPKRAAKEQTLQLLAADASDRLTMHAGHTPNHSLSLLPTAAISQATTASSSGDSTPTLQQSEGMSVPTSTDVSLRADAPIPVLQLAELDAANQVTEAPDHPEPILEPVDDIELKGPLMVRNMPAHDEIFFRRLSDKLEEVSKGHEAALPAVLKDSDAADQPGDQVQKQDNNENIIAGMDGAGAIAAAATSDSDKGSNTSSPQDKASDEEELDIPLKLKRSNNFGAPFGEYRQH